MSFRRFKKSSYRLLQEDAIPARRLKQSQLRQIASGRVLREIEDELNDVGFRENYAVRLARGTVAVLIDMLRDAKFETECLLSGHIRRR